MRDPQRVLLRGAIQFSCPLMFQELVDLGDLQPRQRGKEPLDIALGRIEVRPADAPAGLLERPHGDLVPGPELTCMPREALKLEGDLRDSFEVPLVEEI